VEIEPMSALSDAQNNRDLAARARALGIQEWELQIIEGSPSRAVCADLLADAFPSLRDPPLTEAQRREKFKAIAHQDAVNAARREREEKGLPPEPKSTGWGGLPDREPGARVIDQLMDAEDAQWRAARAKERGQ
jgi:hypothetical protein